MGKVKPKRKSTLIDMTAMSDVTVLLLTFFMLTSTFLQKEPVTVLTPSSVSEIKVPTNNLASILVSPNGKVFISVLGEADPTVADGEWASEPIRKQILETALGEWNRLHPSNKVSLTPSEIETFTKLNMFGVPFTQLKAFLDMSQTEQDKFISNMENPAAGIPVNDNRDLEKPNEFQIWMRAIYSSGNDNLQRALKRGEGIAVKADKGTPYAVVHDVLDNLQTLKMNRFSIMTALKSSED